MKIKYIFILSFLLLISKLLTARETGGYAGSFLRFGLDARGEALGRSLVADDSENSLSFYYNPSLLVNTNQTNIFATYRSLSFDRKFMYAGFSMPLRKNAGLALGILHTGTEDFDGIDSSGEIYNSFSYYENMLHLSFALKLKNNIKVGVNGKFIYSVYPELDDNSNDVYSMGIAADAGINYTFYNTFLKDLTLGASIRDLKGKNSWSGKKVWYKGQDSNDEFPVTIEYGISYSKGFYLENTDFSIKELQKESENNQDLIEKIKKKYPFFSFETYLALENREEDTYFKGGLELNYFSGDYKLCLRNGLDDDLFTTGIGLGFKSFGYNNMLDLSAGLNDRSEEVPVTISWKLSI